MKRSVFNYSTWLVVAGVILLTFGILRTITTSEAAPKDDIIVMGEVVLDPKTPTPMITQTVEPVANNNALPTLPAPEITVSPQELGGSLLPDTNVLGEIIIPEGIQFEPAIPGTRPKETNKIYLEGDLEALKPEVVKPEEIIYEPNQIIIPVIGLDAPVVPAKLLKVKISGYLFDQWAAPETFAAGWHPTSAVLGEKGNTVLNGHHNDYGEVFRRLIDMREGDTILVISHDKVFSYTVTNKIILKETGVTLVQRMQNSRWIAPSLDERLTLVTCWPYESNTHRLLIVAIPSPGSR